MDQPAVRDRAGRGVRALARRLLGRVEDASPSCGGPTRTRWSTAPSTSTVDESPANGTTPTRTRGRDTAGTPSCGWGCTIRAGRARRGRPDLRSRRADRRTGARRRAPAHRAAARAGHAAGPAHRRVRGARRADRHLRGDRHRGRDGAAR
ncbi:hypothetical protein NKG94_13220 [Micromonospora sp. M12]